MYACMCVYMYACMYVCMYMRVYVCVIVQMLSQNFSNYHHLSSLKLMENWLVDSHNLFPAESSVLKCEAVVLISYQYVTILAHFTGSTVVNRLCMGFLFGTLKHFLLNVIRRWLS